MSRIEEAFLAQLGHRPSDPMAAREAERAARRALTEAEQAFDQAELDEVCRTWFLYGWNAALGEVERGNLD